MNNLMYIPFFLFLIAAYIYYQKKNDKEVLFFKEKRMNFLRENHQITEEQSNNLKNNLPWKGMDSALVLDLFGEPKRKRILDETLVRVIWSYADIFIYLNDDKVIEWKSK